MSGSIEQAGRPLSPTQTTEGLCPCCRRVQDHPRLLGCLHTVCTPCLTQVEAVLRRLEANRGVSGRVRPPLQPLGRFLCPQCHSTQVISRLGVSVLPLTSPSMALTPTPTYFYQEEILCVKHSQPSSYFCLTCTIRMCPVCVRDHHTTHRVEQVRSIEVTLGRALKQTVKEIGERLRGIEQDIGRIKAARETGRGDGWALRRQVSSYYSEHEEAVAEHKRRLEEKMAKHSDNTAYLLLREELQLEQARKDLLQLCGQVQALLRRKDRLEVAKLLEPLANRLERIGGELQVTGQAIINKLQFVPLLLPQSQVPGYLSTFAVCPATSHAVIDKPIYEKVLCTIRLHLADDNGIHLDVFRDINLSALMTLYDKKSRLCQTVEVMVDQRDTWSLQFTPPFPGIVHLSVIIGGHHIRNSPYVLSVRSLSLDSEMEETEEDVRRMEEERRRISSEIRIKKNVRFTEVSL